MDAANEGGYSVAYCWSNDRSTDEAYVRAAVDANLTCGTEDLLSALALNVLQVHKNALCYMKRIPSLLITNMQ